MKTQPFNAYIKSIQYKSMENKRTSGEPMLYYAQCNLLECKQGKQNRTFHNAMIFLTKEQFDNQELKVMDKIHITENAQWINKYMSLNVYDEKKLKEFDESRLLKDNNGKTYGKVHFYAYSLKVKPADWSFVERAAESCYIQVVKGVKCFIDETMLNDDSYCFFFGKDTYDKLVDINMQEIDMNCYLHNKTMWKKRIEIQTAFDDTSERFFANLIVKGE